MPKLYIACGCGHEDKSPTSLFIAKQLGKGANLECSKCGGVATVTDGIEEVEEQPLHQEPVIRKQKPVDPIPLKYETSPPGDEVILYGTAKFVLSWTIEEFAGYKIISEELLKQWEEYKDMLYNDEEFRKKIFIMNAFSDEVKVDLLEQTPKLEIRKLRK